MEAESENSNENSESTNESGWFKPSDASKTLWPAKKEAGKTLVEEPRAELIELADEIILYLELPGVRREDMKINASEEHIDITVEKIRETESADTKNAEYLYSCRHLGFSGFYALPARIKPDEIKATHRDGVLEIRAPKASPGGGKEIKID
jgi:HSP20 family protein